MSDAPKPKRKTIAALEAAVADLEGRLKHSQEACANYRRVADSAEREVKEVRAQFVDLKERLANAESVNAEMRGYLARVQEDDAVREELIATGDPNGEQRLVPKRKPHQFFPPDSYTDLSRHDGAMTAYEQANRRPKPRHWVTY